MLLGMSGQVLHGRAIERAHTRLGYWIQYGKASRHSLREHVTCHVASPSTLNDLSGQ